jgi:MFS superfamily sulfate permease-like transporter
LFFANAEQFHKHVLNAINTAPTPVRWFAVAAEPVTSVDVTAADMLAELDDELRQASIQLVFAEMKDPVKDKLKRFGLLSRFNEQHFFPTLGQVVDSYVKTSGVEWEDWEDKKESKTG